MVKIKEVLEGKHTGKDVEIRGWIYRTRSSGSLVFTVVRDSSGILQVTVNKEDVSKRAFEQAEKALIESSIIASGKVVEDKRAPGGYEIRAKDFKIVHLSEVFPISKDLSEEFLLDVRHLWIRSQKMVNVMKVRSTVFEAIHQYFRNNGFYEVQPPMITPAGSEGGATLFSMDYFGNKVYLTQSWQLYAEALVMALEKIYCIAPSFRAEKSRTTRHLTEYWHAEMEMAWAGMEDVIKVAEELIYHICHSVAEKNSEELNFLGRDKTYLKSMKPPFQRMTYDEAIEKLRKAGMEIEWGKDLRTLEERELVAGIEKPLIVTHYPRISQAFYKARDPNNPDVVLAFDIIAPEIGGEIVGGSEREADLEVLRRSLLEQGEDLKNYEWYLDTRRYGSVQHSGFGMGVDRVVQWICKLDHIRDAIAFPRTVARYYP